MNSSDTISGKRRNKRNPFDASAIQVTDMAEMFDKQPPASTESEMALLGAMLLDWRCIGEVLQIVDQPEQFFLPRHGAIFKALVDLYNEKQSLDTVQLIQEMRDRQLLESIGGADYMVSLVEAVPTATHAADYARTVRAKADLRKLINAAGNILKDAYTSNAPPEEIVDQAEQAIFNIRSASRVGDPQQLAQLVDETFHILESHTEGHLTGQPTGYTDLDEMLCGLQKGEMVILAARPSMGKTAFALNIAEHIAVTDGQPVAVFSLEMGKQQLAQRMLCGRSGVDSHRLRKNMIRSDEWSRLHDAAGELANAPMYIDDTPGISIMQLRAKARRLAAQHGIRAIMIDYLQLMTCPGADNRQNEVSEISRGVKALARELDVPVICLSQLNRNAEGRESKRPMLSDLRESGSIEQDADVVMLLHRDDYYRRNDEDFVASNVAEVIIAKQRNGPTGNVKLYFNGATLRFENQATNIDTHGEF